VNATVHTDIGIAAAIAVVTLTVFAPDTARACVACACGDTTLQTTGTERPVTGRLRTTLSVQERSETVGVVGEGGSRVDELRAAATLSYALDDTLQISLTVPVVTKLGIAANLARTLTTGLSDAEARGRVVVYTDRAFAPRHLVALTSELRVPSPMVIDDVKTGEALPIDLQPGLGAFGAQLGFFYALTMRPLAVFFSGSAYAFTVGTAGFRAGPGVLASGTVQFQPMTTVALQVGLDGRTALPNEAGLESKAARTGGGSLVMVSSGVLWSPFTDALLGLVVRVPVATLLPPGEREGPIVLATASYDLLLR
jgi:hypothetical protein